METAAPISIETPKPSNFSSKIVFIDESIFKKENEEYKVQFGIKINDLIIKVIPENIKNFFYYQNCFSLFELQSLSVIFLMYKSISDVISFIKKLKFDIEEKNDELIIKFHIFTPDGENQIIALNLTKSLLGTDSLIKFLFEENKLIKESIKKLETTHESEIKDLKMNVSKNQNELINLKKNIEDYKNEISNLKEENNRMKNELQNLKIIEKENNITPNIINNLIFDSKILSINSIDFILYYIRENDKSFNFNSIRLLYRGSKDGDRTKTCHELCDKKKNILIVIQSDNGYAFGGYSKIGFETKIKLFNEYKIDNDCFLFSINLKKIYPVIKDQPIICNIDNTNGLCFYASLGFFDNFMSHYNNKFTSKIKSMFNKINEEYEMNGGNKYFRCKDLEVFQLI